MAAAVERSALPDRLENAGIGRFSLRFGDPALEAEYRRARLSADRNRIRIWSIGALLSYVVFGAIEWAFLPAAEPYVFVARFGVAYAVFAAGYALAFHVDFQRLFPPTMPLSITAAFVTTAYVYVRMPAGYRELYLAQYVAAMLFLYLHMGLDFRVATPLGWGASALFAVVTLAADGAAWVERDLFAVSVVFIANAMAMFSAYDHELSNRRFFRAGKLLERQRAVEQELQGRLNLLSRQEALGRLAGGVAHDFNNLLQVIAGSAAFALEQAPPRGSVAEQLGLIRRTAQSGAALTRQLLTFSRQHEVQRWPLDLHALILEFLPVLRRVLPGNVEVALRLEAPSAGVLADGAMIEQALLNLAFNARDAMPQGGVFTLGTALAQPTPEFLRGRPWARPEPYVVLSVADTGTGMAREVLERAFEPFFTTKEVGSSSGLGLSMVFGLLRQHDGMIEADSTPGRGSTFRLYLPFHATAQAASPASAEPPAARAEQATLLVVEDNPDLCWVLARMLEGRGYRVISAMDGEEGWQAFQRHRAEIHLALLDVMLPKLGGYDLFGRMRALDPDLPVIFTSGYPGSLSETPPPGAEKVPLLRKPYRNEDLYRMIGEMLGTEGGSSSSVSANPAAMDGKLGALPENGND